MPVAHRLQGDLSPDSLSGLSWIKDLTTLEI
jgi:hypothetical protein